MGDIIEPKIFIDPETQKYIGFSGSIKVYETHIYVDTKTGEGYDKVIKKMEKLISYLSYKFFSIVGCDLEDMRQDIIVFMLEGIPKYDPRKDTKFSTFIQMRVRKRLINEIRDNGRNKKNSTLLNIIPYRIMCECKNKFMLMISSDDNLSDYTCKICGKSVADSKKAPINYTAVSLGGVKKESVDGSPCELNEYEISGDDPYISITCENKFKSEKQINNENDILKLIEELKDDDTKNILRMICFGGYSVKSAADELGIPHIIASNKIKHLKKKRAIKEIFGD